MNQLNSLDSGDIKISSKIKFPNLRSLFLTVGKQLSDLLSSQNIGIYLRGRESGNWVLAISKGLTQTVEDVLKGLNQEQSSELKKSIESRQPCLLEEVLEADKAQNLKGFNLILAPMFYEEEVMGLLLVDFDAFASLSQKDLIQLSLAALLFKIAIEKEFMGLTVVKLEKDLEQKCEQDPQTFLYSESILNWFLDLEIERSLRHGTRFAILSIGIDNIVGIITQYGQSFANLLINQTLDSLGRIVRKCDFLVRRGGEHFLCVSMEQNEAGATVLAEKLRHKAKEMTMNHDGKSVQMTISIGTALWPEGNKITAIDLIHRAEKARQSAQEKGNRVKLWKPELETRKPE